MSAPAAAPATPRLTFGLPVWTILAPLAAMGAIALGKPHDLLATALVAGLLAAAIMAAVYHAEVLAPEGFSALRAAKANRVQTSLNLAIGSALASIGLTIPAVALVSLALGLDLELGLSMGGIVLLALTLLVVTLTLGQGRTTIVP